MSLRPQNTISTRYKEENLRPKKLSELFPEKLSLSRIWQHLPLKCCNLRRSVTSCRWLPMPCCEQLECFWPTGLLQKHVTCKRCWRKPSRRWKRIVTKFWIEIPGIDALMPYFGCNRCDSQCWLWRNILSLLLCFLQTFRRASCPTTCWRA